jgi:hypothetical protein
MKLALIAAALFALTLAAVPLAGPAHAQQGACQTNPDPVDAADPSVIVDAPTSGATVTSPLHVEGQARVFEAVVSLALYDADGDEIVATTTMSAEGQVLSDFSTDVAFSVTADTPACLWVYEVSAKDGSPVNVVQVPLTLRAAGTTLPPTGSGGATDAAPYALFAIAAALSIAGAGLVGAGRLVARG